MPERILKLHPALMMLLSFAVLIFIGAGLLKLPFSIRSGQISLIDALFTATSAVCVTGLTVVDTGTYFTIFGQCVILALIQVGGLGVMTVSVMLFQAIGRNISFRQRMIMQNLFTHSFRMDIRIIIRTILTFTFIAESIGILLLTLHWSQEYPLSRALYMAIFHSISAFCNAGFSLFPDSMVRYHDNLLLNLSLIGLIILGGIGFPVVYDFYLKSKKRKTSRIKLAVQTKVVLVTTFILILAGAASFWILEQTNTLHRQEPFVALIISLFQSITCRTAGFNTVDIASLNDATLLMMTVLMFIGGSPGSCAGGVKTTTLAILATFAWNSIRNRNRINLFKKSIPPNTVNRSLLLVLISAILIGSILFLLLARSSVAHPALYGRENRLLVYLFETVSAFGTVGLSMGVTPSMPFWGESWIILLMYIGRVGVLTFAYTVVGGGLKNGVEYAEESLMVG